VNPSRYPDGGAILVSGSFPVCTQVFWLVAFTQSAASDILTHFRM
jgi:hypothetical protein